MVPQTGSTGAWRVTDVSGHPASVFEPHHSSPHGYTVLYLHSAGGEDPADDPVFGRELARCGLRAVAPRAPATWWSDRVLESFDPAQSAERYLLDDVLPWIAEQLAAAPPRVALLGISMGGQGGLRLAYKYPDRFPVVAAIAAAIDFHRWLEQPPGQPELADEIRQLYRDAEDARQDTATLHVHPLNWPRHQWFATDPADHWWESADRLAMKLSSLGVPHDRDLETTAGGHSWQYFHAMLPRAMDYLFAGLESERLRLPLR